MKAKAIKTNYDGCRFRSRLEARWAVFLNEIQVDWDYEPEGFLVNVGNAKLPWLPDFRLENGQLVEVKGDLNEEQMVRLILLATGAAQCGNDSDVVILGRIPKYRSARWPVQLHSHDGLWALPWDLMTGCPLIQHRPRAPLHELEPDVVKDLLLNGMMYGEPGWAVGAADKARGARFEFGESG